MNTAQTSSITLSLFGYTIMVMSVCFLPLIQLAPWWMLAFIVSFICFKWRFIYIQRPVPAGVILILSMMLIGMLAWQYRSFASNDFFIGCLMMFYWLKLIEIKTTRDLRILALISFYIIFAVLITHLNLWVFFYLFLALGLIFSLLIKIESPTVNPFILGKQGLLLLLFSLPVVLLLFFIFPRITEPLWQIQFSQQGKTAFKETLSPGSLASLAPDESLVMRILFHHQPRQIPAYWNGLVLTNFSNNTWSASSRAILVPLSVLPNKQTADYEVLLEPHGKPWLFYQNHPAKGWPKLKFNPAHGLTRLDGKPIHQRQIYALSNSKPSYRALNANSLKRYINLPPHSNPKLRQWAEHHYAQNGANSNQFIAYLKQYIHQQPFWYKLEPKSLGSGINQLDRFWFETREGYCEHYASALAFILRSAGIPARIVVGYFGGEWNPIGGYLNIRQQNAHAWIEYWQPEKGWILFDPTAYIAIPRIDRKLLDSFNKNQAIHAENRPYLVSSWANQLRLQLESAWFFTERWLLFYNQEKQETLLHELGFSTWNLAQLVQISIGIMLLFLVMGWAYYQSKFLQKDPFKKAIEQLQKELQQAGIEVKPPNTLRQQLLSFAYLHPKSAPVIKHFLHQYETLRLKYADTSQKQTMRDVKKLLQRLRYFIRKNRC